MFCMTGCSFSINVVICDNIILMWLSAVDSATSAARGIVFVNTWAAVTAKAGMRDLTKTAQKLRLGNLTTKNKIDALIDDDK